MSFKERINQFDEFFFVIFRGIYLCSLSTECLLPALKLQDPRGDSCPLLKKGAGNSKIERLYTSNFPYIKYYYAVHVYCLKG